MTTRIKQAIAKVTLLTGKYFWIRISRQNIDNLIRYWRNYPNFKYLKVYEIVNYSSMTTKMGRTHEIGRQLGFITLNGFRFF